MKIISFILALAILVLSCIPCSDTKTVVTEHHSLQLSSSQSSGHSEKNHQDHHDFCSPFCQCSCCGVACTIPNIQGIATELQATFTAKTFAAYEPQRPIGIDLPVWQPPKFTV